MTAAKARILVVEAEGSHAVVEDLRKLGYDVCVTATTANQALDLAEPAHPDLILFDVGARDFASAQHAALALRPRSGVPLLYLGANGDAAPDTRVASGAFSGYLVKPLESVELRSAIELALQRSNGDGGNQRREDTRALQQLELNDRLAALGTLAAGVAHEVNNPLAFILGNIQYALGELETIEALGTAMAPEVLTARVHEVCAALADAQTGAERIRRIVSELRRLTRPDGEKKEALDLRKIIDKALTLTARELSDRARVVREFGAVPPVLGEDTRLTQVFVNLLMNAAHAIQPGGAEHNEIRVVTGTDGEGRAFAEIRDTGSGIPQEVIPRIFDPYFTTRPLPAGTGLGLSISHGIVSSLGGTIDVQSRMGVGSTFRVVLPPVSETTRTGRASIAPSRGARPRLLVVDDERFLLETIARTLDEPYAVQKAHGGRDALALLERGDRFDLILCDLLMPDMTGMEVHAELCARFPDQAKRTVFMTGGAFTPKAQTFLNGGSHRVLEKPFSNSELLAFLEHCLAETRTPEAAS